MDLLVVVGEATPPARLAARARRTVHVEPGAALVGLVADVRSHIPRRVGVLGAGADAGPVAEELHHRGLPVVLHTDDPVEVDPGIPVFPIRDIGPAMDVADSLVDLIGNTPMVRLDHTARNVDCHLLAKLELFNPGFSSKDRPALLMIQSAERDGRLQPGGTIVEPTSGNTGVGLAIVAAHRGYHCVFVCPDKVATDKIAQLRAYGAEVVVCPTSVDPEHPDSYYSVSDRLAKELPGAWKPDQYHNPDNPRAQEETTGPEIWEQTRGRVTTSCAGWAPAARSPGSARRSRPATPTCGSSGPIPRAPSTRGAPAGRTWWRG